MSHKRLKGKSRELLSANSNHLCLVIALIIAFTFGIMLWFALYLVGDFISDGLFAALILLIGFLLFLPLITGIYRMAGLAYGHKDYGIIDVFYAFSSVKNYIRVFLINLLGLVKLLIPVLAGCVWFGVWAVILENISGSEWISAFSAVLVGVITLPPLKRFYAVNYLVCVEDMGVIGAIKLSIRSTKKRSIKLALATAKFLPITVLSVIPIMVPYVIYNFPFRACLYSVICGELKSEYDRENGIIEIKNDKCPETIASGVEEINEQHS